MNTAVLDKLLRPLSRLHIGAAARFAVGVALAFLRVGDARPFGIVYGLSGKKDYALRCAGAFLGSLCALSRGGVLYAAAIMICFACRVVLRDTPVGKNRLFMPLCISVSLFCVKIPSVMVRGLVRGMGGLLLEALLTGVLCLAAEEYMSAAGVSTPPPAADPPISGALRKLGDIVEHQASYAPTKTVDNALEWAFDSVCSTCQSSKDCWSAAYAQTRRAIDRIRDTVVSGKPLTEEELPEPLAHKCPRSSRLCSEINLRVAGLRARENAKKKQQQSCALMKKQYDCIADLIRDAKGDSGTREEFMSLVRRKAEGVAKGYFGRGDCSTVFDGERIVLTVFLNAGWHSEDISAVTSSLSLAIGCTVTYGGCVDTPSGKALRYFIEGRLSVQVDSACVAKERERISGDCCRHMVTPDKRQIVILSDGMGTGEKAGRLSCAAADAVIGLVQAGVSLSSAAQALCSALEAQVDSAGFATLDMVEIDLLSGRCLFVKYGAQPSYIVRNGRVQKVWRQSLPAGLGGEGECLTCLLSPGDRIVMMTDGAREPEDFSAPAASLCRELTSGRALDDMTAAVITVSGG